MSYKEKDLTADFSKWRRTNPKACIIRFNWGVEFKLKYVGKSLHLIRDFQPQQVSKLLETKYGCVYTKHSDMSIGLKNYDATQICYSPAFVAVCWYEPRVRKTLYFVDVSDIKRRIDGGYLKYIEADAKGEAVYTIELM